MSAATATNTPADAPAAKGGKKKMMIIVLAAVVLLALAGGGAAVFMMKQKAAALAAEDGDEDVAHAEAPAQAKVDPKSPPVFMPLDPFTVNLADRENERYAQIGVTLQIDGSKTSDQLALYMPAIRNNILMVLSHKTAAELLTREGKEKLAKSILHAAVRPLGYDVADDEDVEAAEEKPAPGKKKKKKPAAPVLPVKAVHFSNFIVQ